MNAIVEGVFQLMTSMGAGHTPSLIIPGNLLYNRQDHVRFTLVRHKCLSSCKRRGTLHQLMLNGRFQSLL